MNDSTAHTPGPWAATEMPPYFVHKHWKEIATVWDGGQREEVLANARVIAAAPDMRAALETVADTLAWRMGISSTPMRHDDEALCGIVLNAMRKADHGIDVPR